MLVLSRTKQQSIVVESAAGFDHMIEITVLSIRNGKVTLGINVKDDVADSREDVVDLAERRHSTVRPHRTKRRRASAMTETDRRNGGGG